MSGIKKSYKLTQAKNISAIQIILITCYIGASNRNDVFIAENHIKILCWKSWFRFRQFLFPIHSNLYQQAKPIKRCEEELLYSPHSQFYLNNCLWCWIETTGANIFLTAY